MSFCFHSCIYLEVIDISKWDLSKVENMDTCFGGCYKLKSIGVDNLDISNVKSKMDCFAGCDDLILKVEYGIRDDEFCDYIKWRELYP